MADSHVEIHDPFSNHNGIHKSTDCDLKSTSDLDSMEDTVEFRILMAYAKRRRPEKESPPQDGTGLVSGGPEANGSASPPTPDNTEKEETKKKKKRRKRKGLRLRQRLGRIFGCIKPQATDEDLYQYPSAQPDEDDRCGDDDDDDVVESVKEVNKFEEAADRLTRIADEIRFVPPEVEPDSPQDEDEDVEKLMGLLLRETGDKVNEEGLNQTQIAKELFWNYSFFKKLVTALLTRMGLRSPDPESPGPKASPATQIAVTCEVTSRLSAMNWQHRKLLLNHGARYLQDYYSSWVQEQGGYEKAFYSEDEDDEDDTQ